MSRCEPVIPVMPCVSVLYHAGSGLEPFTPDIFRCFGLPLLASGSFPFDMTCYYEKEMGSPLERRWFCFGLADPSGLSRWKRDCMEIEESFSERRRRRVNLDPGYLDLGKLVLASCKAAPDKIYLSDGVYAHTCLRYGRGAFAAPDHSFADFIDGRFNGFFMEARALYRKALR